MNEGLNIGQLPWTSFVVYTLMACLVYWVIKIGMRSRLLSRINIFPTRVIKSLKIKLDLWLPVFLALLVLVLFVSINPIVHGIILFFILIIGYRSISHLFNGLALRNESGLKESQRLEYNGHIGIIEKIGIFGLHIRSGSGLLFVNYSNLMDNGINMSSSESAMPYVNILIKMEDEEKQWSRDQLLSQLSMIPYIDWSRGSEIQLMEDGSEAAVSFYLKNKKYVISLKKLIKEWGFTITQNRKND